MAGPRRKPQRKSGGRKRRAPSRDRSSTWLWGATLLALVGGIFAYDNSADVRRFAGSLTGESERKIAAARAPSSKARQDAKAQHETAVALHVPVPQKPVRHGAAETKRTSAPAEPDDIRTAAITPPAPIGRPQDARARSVAMRPDLPAAADGQHRAKFYLCGTAKQDDCVIAADTFMLKGQKIRIAGIEVPDIQKPRCEAERIKASDAKLRVRAFLDSGPFDVLAANAGDEDSNGRKIRAVTRGGVSLSDILVREGLARRPGATGGWC